VSAHPRYKTHPTAEALPLLEGEALDALAADIRANGLITPITLLGGRILEGRNRMRACRAAGVKPRFEACQGNDPVAFVISANIDRS
jgi:ParB-like chromosome segregation protein Spo0J